MLDFLSLCFGLVGLGFYVGLYFAGWFDCLPSCVGWLLMVAVLRLLVLAGCACCFQFVFWAGLFALLLSLGSGLRIGGDYWCLVFGCAVARFCGFDGLVLRFIR